MTHDQDHQTGSRVRGKSKPQTTAAPTFDRLMTLDEVAEVIGKSVEATRKMVQRGQLPAVKVGREFRIRASAFARYLEGLPPV